MDGFTVAGVTPMIKITHDKRMGVQVKVNNASISAKNTYETAKKVVEALELAMKSDVSQLDANASRHELFRGEVRLTYTPQCRDKWEAGLFPIYIRSKDLADYKMALDLYEQNQTVEVKEVKNVEEIESAANTGCVIV